MEQHGVKIRVPHPRFPPEIWRNILSDLRRDQILHLRAVNRVFYDIAMDHGFRELEIEKFNRHWANPQASRASKASGNSRLCTASDPILILEEPFAQCILDIFKYAKTLKEVKIIMDVELETERRMSVVKLYIDIQMPHLSLLVDSLTRAKLPRLKEFDLTVRLARSEEKNTAHTTLHTAGIHKFFEHFGSSLQFLRLATKDDALASCVAAILFIMPQLRELDVVTTFEEPLLIKSINTNYSALNKLTMKIVVLKTHKTLHHVLPFSSLVLPNLSVLKLTTGEHDMQTFWSGSFTSDRLQELYLIPHNMARVTDDDITRFCEFFGRNRLSVTELEVRVAEFTKSLIDRIAITFPNLSGLSLFATYTAGIGSVPGDSRRLVARQRKGSTVNGNRNLGIKAVSGTVVWHVAGGVWDRSMYVGHVAIIGSATAQLEDV
ncbi:hypothetical protein EYR40_001619 [Pleurotus pulmonarius]|nr:hypothetical protein EYR36_000022 [Pleurotus pulmonarius]KAF4609266.1 hypothetical protein EYR40_001619 [Pleurotus pulmonarius]